MMTRMVVITPRVGQVQAVTPILYEISGAASVLDVERLTIFPPKHSFPFAAILVRIICPCTRRRLSFGGQWG